MQTELFKKEPIPNNKQQECIDNINGKYLVLAGPGTGKTFTITQRIKHMLQDKGVNPEKILCLTFSDAAAEEMKKRIEKNCINAACVNIFTYHSFCNEIISQNPQEFELNENYKKIPDTISREFLKECIDEYDAKAYRNNKNNPYVYLSLIGQKISAIKKYRLNKEDYFNNIKTNPDWIPLIKSLEAEIEELKNSDKKNKEKSIEKKIKEIAKIEEEIAKATEVWDYYELYKSKMERANYIDFDDMINFVLEKFETDSVFLDKIANNYEYILVDEYQDTNKSQNAIVFNLVHAIKTQNIFVVGDDDQIVYAFQGANMDTMENFLREFPDTKVICLKENMRSTQSILDLAKNILKFDDNRLETNPEFQKYNIDKTLIAKNENIISKDKKVNLTIYENPDEETIDIVEKIDNLIKSENCPTDENGDKKLSEIAIIVTSHDVAAEFAKLFELKNIPTQRAKTKSIFEIKSFITLFYYLQMLANPELYSNKILMLLLMKPFEIHPTDFSKILEEISKNKTIFETMKEFHDWVNPSKIEKFINVYDELLEYKTNETTKNTILEVGAKTGIFEHFINSPVNKSENISAIQKILSEAQDYSDFHGKPCLEEFVSYLLMVQEDKDIDIKIDEPPLTLNAVQIITYQGSKGREFDYVFLPSLQASKWNSSSRPSLKPEVPVNVSEYKSDEERKALRQSDRIKNLYVGMTRARHSLNLSYTTASAPCVWIQESQEMLNIEKGEEFTPEKYTNIQISSIQKTSYDYERDFSERINSVLKNKKYSASSVNRYLKCPRMYLYSDILDFNTRFGFADAAYYGSAFHEACKYMVEKAKQEGFYPTKEDFLQIFKKTLSTFPFSTPESRKIYEGRGEKELNNYYHHLTDVIPEKIYGAEISIKDDEDKFVGWIDRVEKEEDGTYTIIDYKTSDPDKIKKQICIDGEHEDYYNQLCLYKYYFEKQENKKVGRMLLYFPLNNEPFELAITEEEYQNAIQRYKNIREDILKHKFEKTNKTYPCQYCQYKDFCDMNRV